MPDPLIRFAGATHVGLKRERNEDSYLLRPEAGLWAVADGMGGHGGGDVASQMAISALEQVAAAPTGETLLAAVEAAIADANLDMRAYARAENRVVIGTTLVALLMFGEHFACLWCGDSRAYRLRAGALRQLTRDHSESQDLVDRGVLDPEEAKVWPRRNVLTRALGVSDAAELEIVSDRLAAGDVFLLCSDGLTGHLDEAEIAAALGEADPQAACGRLIALTLERGASDNVTVVVLAVPSPRAAAPAR
jgi:serine/threonine protein phosphatase PrpC